MLLVKDLNVLREGSPILKGLNFNIKPGEIHTIMGANGAGKSTLVDVLAGKEDVVISSGNIKYHEEDLLKLSITDRALKGIFIAFQHPVSIPGVLNLHFLKSICNASRKFKQQPIVDAIDFLMLVKNKLRLVGLDESYLYRAVNEGFSGGEKKKNELLQMAILDPTLCVLDEIDSGLDVDSLKVVSHAINEMKDTHRSFLLITHYPRILTYVKPDHVHVLKNGKFVCSGDYKLALEIEKKGYEGF